MADLKRNFMFPERNAVPPVENRIANALEFIAYYLDRIDDHLEKLAIVGEGSGELLAKLRGDVHSIAHVLARK